MSEDSRTRILTEHLRRYESKLYAIRDDKTKAIHVMREGTIVCGPFEHEGIKYLYTKPSPHFIMALTDNWNVRGTPVDWGIEPLLARLQEIDSWNRGRTVDDLIKSYEKRDASMARDRMNQHESWAYDHRSLFKKDWKDINTSNLT